MEPERQNYAEKLLDLFDRLDEFSKAMVFAYGSGILAAQDKMSSLQPNSSNYHTLFS